MGAITERVRAYVPATYDAMILSDPPFFPAADLQALADFVKYRLFGTLVPEADESTAYNGILITFLGKLTTLQFIPAAIDYWDSRLASEVVPGEVQQFRDHLAGLEALFKMLSDEVTQDWALIGPGLGFNLKKRRIPKVSYGDNGRQILKTPDPFHIRAYNDDRRLGNLCLLPWRVDV